MIERLVAPGSSFQKRFFFLARRFVAGETIDSAIAAVRGLNDAGMAASLDFLGEDVLDRATATKTTSTYIAMLDAIGSSGVRSNVSVKLTAIGILIDEGFALENLVRILERAKSNADPFVRIDMEGSALTERTLALFERAFRLHDNVGIVLQAMLKRTAADVERAIALGARVRLCKGAYRESSAVAYAAMPEIRAAYARLAEILLVRGTYPGIATHDRRLIAAVTDAVRRDAIATDRFEFQMLYGCRPQLQRRLVAEGYRMRIYVPFGTHWAGYFYRRVAERRENALFALSSILRR
ncbi:MAG: proline dehydrogenase family protein [Candidatus Tyrphobacter sp.]